MSRTIPHSISSSILSWFLAMAWILCLVPVSTGENHGYQTLPDKGMIPSGRADLKRSFDVIIMQGEQIPGLCGKAREKIRVLALKDGLLEPIPFQIDERNKENELVFSHGPMASADQDPAFDGNDLLLFMASDMGDQASAEGVALPGSYAEEIKAIDPLDGSRAWGYAVYSPEPLPLNPTDYVRYTIQPEKIDNVDAQHYSIYYPWGQYYTDTEFIPPASGGTGVDFLDRLKARGSFKLFFSLFTIRLTEDRMGSQVSAYLDGPIRVMRRVDYWAKFGFGIRSSSFQADITYYPAFIHSPVTLRIPVKLDLFLSDARTTIGNEYTHHAYGMIFTNSNNPDGTLIDGRMSPQEEVLDPAPGEWVLLTGPQGTMLRGSVPAGKGSEQVKVTQGYVDDYRSEDPPEEEPGQIGFIHEYTDMTHMEPGEYKLDFRFHFPPHFRPGEEEEYLRRERTPLETTTRGVTIAY